MTAPWRPPGEGLSRYRRRRNAQGCRCSHPRGLGLPGAAAGICLPAQRRGELRTRRRYPAWPATSARGPVGHGPVHTAESGQRPAGGRASAHAGKALPVRSGPVSRSAISAASAGRSVTNNTSSPASLTTRPRLPAALAPSCRSGRPVGPAALGPARLGPADCRPSVLLGGRVSRPSHVLLAVQTSLPSMIMASVSYRSLSLSARRLAR